MKQRDITPTELIIASIVMAILAVVFVPVLIDRLQGREGVNGIPTQDGYVLEEYHGDDLPGVINCEYKGFGYYKPIICCPRGSHFVRVYLFDRLHWHCGKVGSVVETSTDAMDPIPEPDVNYANLPAGGGADEEVVESDNMPKEIRVKDGNGGIFTGIMREDESVRAKLGLETNDHRSSTPLRVIRGCTGSCTDLDFESGRPAGRQVIF